MRTFMSKKEKKVTTKKEKKSKLIAKRDFKIVHNKYVFDIKEGDDISHIPEMFLCNLKVEKVID